MPCGCSETLKSVWAQLAAPWHEFNEHTIFYFSHTFLVRPTNAHVCHNCYYTDQCTCIYKHTCIFLGAFSLHLYRHAICLLHFLSKIHQHFLLCYYVLFNQSSRRLKQPCEGAHFSLRYLLYLQGINTAGLLRTHKRHKALKSWHHEGRFCQVPYWNELERNVLIVFLDGNDTTWLRFRGDSISTLLCYAGDVDESPRIRLVSRSYLKLEHGGAIDFVYIWCD